MKLRHIVISLVAAAALTTTGGAFAGSGHGHNHGGHAKEAEQGERTAEGTGKVHSVAEDGGSVVLEHGPIPELRWPAMTMELPLTDPALAEGLEPGSQVHFVLRQIGATDYEIISIESAHEH
ncbi:MAG: copper-binding protein [Ectothiorhodospiraceae bacterium]|nr:copper-binding protein [Ectothiorhodospiraceae bacterium]